MGIDGCWPPPASAGPESAAVPPPHTHGLVRSRPRAHTGHWAPRGATRPGLGFRPEATLCSTTHSRPAAEIQVMSPNPINVAESIREGGHVTSSTHVGSQCVHTRAQSFLIPGVLQDGPS